MNAFNKTSLKASDLIEVVYFRKGLIPQTFTCGCCGDETAQDDHMSGHFTKAHTKSGSRGSWLQHRIAYSHDRDLFNQEYERRESDVGGVDNINSRQVLSDITEEIGASAKEARGVMLDYWNVIEVG
ncbi:hypothetical protein DL239_21110 [Sedimentitalea sp. CY04]|uniref:C2H2-type domain-containing protein n=1 Tax=Parasedimentitalea denitrificans TaxID=2211118 RepID=A0ABX0WGE2_9RHOB|nr:hypothetical protein [Sedimentitalea sp. CY04]NIZ63466.1 hypothetical protein [Sedimentitalea sp. CY04]